MSLMNALLGQTLRGTSEQSASLQHDALHQQTLSNMAANAQWPASLAASNYRRPDQVIRPWMFGHHFRKDVCLWLKNLPPLMSTHIVGPPHKKLDFWSTKRNVDGKSLKSVTFQGIADAMAAQWT